MKLIKSLFVIGGLVAISITFLIFVVVLIPLYTGIEFRYLYTTLLIICSISGYFIKNRFVGIILGLFFLTGYFVGKEILLFHISIFTVAIIYSNKKQKENNQKEGD